MLMVRVKDGDITKSKVRLDLIGDDRGNIPLTSLISISSFGFGASTSYSDGRFCVHRLSIGTIKEEENSSSGGPTLCLCYLINANEIKWRLAINLSM